LLGSLLRPCRQRTRARALLIFFLSGLCTLLPPCRSLSLSPHLHPHPHPLRHKSELHRPPHPPHPARGIDDARVERVQEGGVILPCLSSFVPRTCRSSSREQLRKAAMTRGSGMRRRASSPLPLSPVLRPPVPAPSPPPLTPQQRVAPSPRTLPTCASPLAASTRRGAGRARRGGGVGRRPVLQALCLRLRPLPVTWRGYGEGNTRRRRPTRRQRPRARSRRGQRRGGTRLCCLCR
ncbi:hypothetical protein B0H13DRAFT_2059356, partial [Mycena leptocephala]